MQGDVIGITDKDGVLIATYAYDAWGKPISVEGDLTIANLNPIRYRGYYYDTKTGLYYLNSRYYDPEICRFINADEAYFVCLYKNYCNNLFAYCENNAILGRDSSGYFDYSKYKPESWIFKLLAKYKDIISKGENPNYYLINTEGSISLKLEVGVERQFKIKNKKDLESKLKGFDLKLKWGGKLEYDIQITTGVYTINYICGTDWVRSYLTFLLSCTTKDGKYTGYCKAYISVDHWIKLLVAITITGACIVFPAIAPVFSKAFSVLGLSGTKIIEALKSIVWILAAV